MTKIRIYRAYTKYGNDFSYSSKYRKGSKGNEQDLLNELKKLYDKYMSIKDITLIVLEY